MRTAIAALLLIGASLLTGAIGGIASANAPEFYAQLVKPSWAPPPWLFGPVWSALYLLMGIAALLVWRERGWNRVLAFFLVHLVVNALWSWFFFAWRSGPGSLGDIALLWVMIATLIVLFWRVKPIAGALLLPYLGWVTFASALNWAIVRANPAMF